MGMLVVLSTIRTITYMLDILRAAGATSRQAVSKGRFGSPLAIHGAIMECIDEPSAIRDAACGDDRDRRHRLDHGGQQGGKRP
jgi:hypothetical protein